MLKKGGKVLSFCVGLNWACTTTLHTLDGNYNEAFGISVGIVVNQTSFSPTMEIFFAIQRNASSRELSISMEVSLLTLRFLPSKKGQHKSV